MSRHHHLEPARTTDGTAHENSTTAEVTSRDPRFGETKPRRLSWGLLRRHGSPRRPSVPLHFHALTATPRHEARDRSTTTRSMRDPWLCSSSYFASLAFVCTFLGLVAEGNVVGARSGPWDTPERREKAKRPGTAGPPAAVLTAGGCGRPARGALWT